jgi:hypothetical protein
MLPPDQHSKVAGWLKQFGHLDGQSEGICQFSKAVELNDTTCFGRKKGLLQLDDA